MDVRPLLLVPDKDVEVEMVENSKLSPHLGICEQIGHSRSSEGRYKIIIYKDVCKEVHQGSWIRDKVSFDQFILGVLTHEVCHIKYNSFEHMSINSLKNVVDNVLEDSRIEYALVLENPRYAELLHWVLAGIKYSLSAEHITKFRDNKKEVKEKVDKANKLIEDLYFLTRFGVVRTEADDKFISFCLPFVLSAKRMGRENAFQAASMIADYIQMEVEEQNLSKYVGKVGILVKGEEREKGKEGSENQDSEGDDIFSEDPVVAKVKEEIDAVGESEGVLHDTLIETKPIDQNEAAEAEKGDAVLTGGGLQNNKKGPELGRVAGGKGAKLDIREKDNAFYRSVVNTHQELISRIRSIFKRYFETASQVTSYDGDINIARQQEAYLSSILREPGPDYHQMQLKDPSLDVVVYRDVSSSTESWSREYACSAVCILAALEDIKGVRTGLINFASEFQVTKRFEEDLNTRELHPYAYGGTMLYEALVETSNWDWAARNRIAIVVTDGAIFDWHKVSEHVKRLKEEKGMQFVWLKIGMDCKVEDIPSEIASAILGRLRSGKSGH